MRLEHFRYLLEVNRLHSISAAARRLHINQTTLSAIIKSAEEEIGFPIFQRTPNGVAATTAGVQLMSLAWEIDMKYDRLMALKKRSSIGVPTIPLLLSPTIAGRLAMPLLDRFYAQEIPGNLSLMEVSSESMAERIQNHEANLGLGFFSKKELMALEHRQNKSPLTVEILRKDKLFLMVGKNHPLASLPQVSVPSVYSERLATVKRKQNDDMILGSMHHFCRSLTCFSSLEALVVAIRDQGMVGFIPKFAWNPKTCASCTLVPIRDTDRENLLYLSFLTSKDRQLRPQEDILAQCIRQCLSIFDLEEQEQKGEISHED